MKIIKEFFQSSYNTESKNIILIGLSVAIAITLLHYLTT